MNTFSPPADQVGDDVDVIAGFDYEALDPDVAFSAEDAAQRFALISAISSRP